MTRDQIIDLLTLIVGFDQRTVGEGDVAAWQAICEAEKWTWPLARRAAIEYHRRGADKPRITPAAISDKLAELRTTIRQRVVRTDITPPRELADDPAAEIAWKRAYVATATTAALEQWAATGCLPAALPATAELEAVSPDDLDSRARQLVEAFAARSPKALR